ncbi:MFS transporter [Pantoea vagans]|uniref:MFS transporter n=1 Tax=Pantoea vagans TaxID=470934 RepID=UPI0023B02147|nr:MFS transporter [Pantoea vagans]MDE8559384.1 MFS transporter [Pantoea vagans]MDE8579379.1 MFS transporter [Pantoea vagans]
MSLTQRLDRLPLSRPHYMLLFIGGLGYTFDGMDVAIVSFLFPAIRTLWSLSNADLGMIGSATPVGVLIGALIAGYAGDRFGRKVVMCWALALYCIMTLVAALSPTVEVFFLARIFAGIGTGAESVIIAPYLSEFISPKKRGWFIGSLAGFFSFGFVGAAIIGRFIIPEIEHGWRYAQIITAFPIIMLLWWRRSLPESPRFLLSKGRTAEAEKIVSLLEEKVERATRTPLPPVETKESYSDEVKNTRSLGLLDSLKVMFSTGNRKQTSVIWLIWFVVTFCYYGFFAWIPSLLIARGFTVTKSFEFSIIIYLAQIPGYYCAAFLSDYLDRKKTISLFLAGSALSAWCLSQSNTTGDIVLFAAILSFFLNGCYAGLYTYTPESFPTKIRAIGCGFSSAFGRMGSILAPSIIGYFTTSMGFSGVFTMTSCVLCAGIVILLTFGVRTKGSSLEDILPNSPSQTRNNE